MLALRPAGRAARTLRRCDGALAELGGGSAAASGDLLETVRGDWMIAVLFCDPRGTYAEVPGLDLWDEARDARNYAGPWPVVAHPPCQSWGAMAAVNHARWGGEHNQPGNDGGCFASALRSVLTFGGVLEHPAKSRAWRAHGLAQPVTMGWQYSPLSGGWVCEVWQSAYGHKANKATWLYYVGKIPPLPPQWERVIGSHQIGYTDSNRPGRNKPTVTKREAIATPALFRDVLLSLARMANPQHLVPTRQNPTRCGVSSREQPE